MEVETNAKPIEPVLDRAFQLAKEKSEIFRAMIASGPVLARVDPRKPRVSLPPHMVERVGVICTFTADALVTDFGLSQTLKIPRPGVDGEEPETNATEPFPCFIPWDAVWALDSTKDAGASFFADACPEEQVRVMFSQLMQARANVHHLRQACTVAIRAIQQGAPMSGLRLWARDAAAMLNPEQEKRKIEIVRSLPAGLPAGYKPVAPKE